MTTFGNLVLMFVVMLFVESYLPGLGLPTHSRFQVNYQRTPGNYYVKNKPLLRPRPLFTPKSTSHLLNNDALRSTQLRTASSNRYGFKRKPHVISQPKSFLANHLYPSTVPHHVRPNSESMLGTPNQNKLSNQVLISKESTIKLDSPAFIDDYIGFKYDYAWPYGSKKWKNTAQDDKYANKVNAASFDTEKNIPKSKQNQVEYLVNKSNEEPEIYLKQTYYKERLKEFLDPVTFDFIEELYDSTIKSQGIVIGKDTNPLWKRVIDGLYDKLYIDRQAQHITDQDNVSSEEGNSMVNVAKNPSFSVHRNIYSTSNKRNITKNVPLHENEITASNVVKGISDAVNTTKNVLKHKVPNTISNVTKDIPPPSINISIGTHQPLDKDSEAESADKILNFESEHTFSEEKNDINAKEIPFRRKKQEDQITREEVSISPIHAQNAPVFAGIDNTSAVHKEQNSHKIDTSDNESSDEENIFQELRKILREYQLEPTDSVPRSYIYITSE